MAINDEGRSLLVNLLVDFIVLWGSQGKPTVEALPIVAVPALQRSLAFGLRSFQQ